MEQYQIRVVILFFLMGSILCVILSTSGDHWIKGTTSYSGLWRKCVPNGPHKTVCKELPSDDTLPGFFHYVRSFYVIGLIFLAIGVLYFVVMVARPRNFGPACLSVFAICGGLCVLVALSVYTYYQADTFTNSVMFHWSYFVGWLAVFFCCVTAVISCTESRKPSAPYGNAYRLE